MPGDLPEYHFRDRDNGAAVFRVETETRQRHIAQVEIATVNIKNGNVNPLAMHDLRTVLARRIAERLT